MTKPTRPVLGILLAITTMLLFASMDSVSKVLVDQFSVTQILWVRYAVFLVFALCLALPKLGRTAIKTRRPWLQITRSLVLVAEIGVFVFAFRYMEFADVHAVAAIAPLMVTAMSVPFLGERVGPRRWAAVAIGLVGMLVILRPGFSVFDPAALIALAGAALFALYQVLTRMAAEDPAEVSLLYTGLVGFVVLTFFGPFFWVWPTITETGLLAAAGLLGVVAHLALIKALSLAPASTLQPFNYTLIVWATLIGFLIFDTFPDSWTLVGAGIIVCSGLYALARERRAKT